MWFFIVLIILSVCLKLGDWSFYLGLCGLLLFFANWVINKLLKPEDSTDGERIIILILKIVVLALIWKWYW